MSSVRCSSTPWIMSAASRPTRPGYFTVRTSLISPSWAFACKRSAMAFRRASSTAVSIAARSSLQAVPRFGDQSSKSHAYLAIRSVGRSLSCTSTSGASILWKRPIGCWMSAIIVHEMAKCGPDHRACLWGVDGVGENVRLRDKLFARCGRPGATLCDEEREAFCICP